MYVLGTTKRACELFITRSREIKSQISAKKKKKTNLKKRPKKKKNLQNVDGGQFDL